MVVGAVLMLAMQASGLRDIPLRPMLDFSHPAVRKIFFLYAPVGLSVIVSSVALIIDRNLASRAEGWISAMRYATTLVQFGLGMVAAAISLASLPSLSQHFSHGNFDAYKRTLASGLRLVMVLALPAAAVLFALAQPLVSLIFEHGAYTATDRDLTVQALLLYTIGFPFGAIDQVLIIAFYARKNTITPVLVGIAAVGVYLAVALTLVDPLGMRGLVLANSAQLTFHALVTGFLLWRVLRPEGGLGGYGIGNTTLKVAGASVTLAVVSYALWVAFDAFLRPDSFVEKLVALAVPALVGGGLYAVLIRLMRLPEVELITDKIVGRLRPFLRLPRRG
jgi:putative peptidoglycan lipid II flippase